MWRSHVIRTILIFFFFMVFVPLRVSLLQAADFSQPTGFVNDFARMLSSGFRQALEQELENFDKETSAEVTVVTIDSLEGDSIENYAVRLFEEWKIGKKGEDNGVLILIAKQERKMRIEVGYGLEPIITDGRAGRIIREKMRPAFRGDNYDQGVKLAVGQIEEYIRVGQPPTEIEKVKEKTIATLPLIMAGGIALIYLSAFLARSKRFWPGGAIGGLIGGVLGLIIGTMITFILLAIGLGLFGLILDWILSKNYKKLKQAGRPTGFFPTWGGFSSGGGRGFGGFGGGSSGGGGASGGW